MTDLRPISPISLPDDWPRSADFGPRPQRVKARPTDLLVDATYQRELNRKSMNLIRRIVAGFKWRKVKTPTCVRVGGRLHVIDGQHTAIAAATLGVDEIWVDVVDASSELERADSFVAHNRDRLQMTPFDVYKAQVGAKHALAVAVDQACRDAGVRVIRVINKLVKSKVGDTAAVGQLLQVCQRRGREGTAKVLRALVGAGRSPITAAEIAAAEAVMYPTDGKPALGVIVLSGVSRDGGDGLVARANADAKLNRTTAKAELVRAYRRLAGRRAAA